MALVLADRVKETSTTTGTGTYTLAGAVTGFESFASIGNGNTTYYACTLGSDFEVGIGTYTASGTTLARTTILQSSNSDNAVDWGSGTKTLFCTQPAEKAVFRDASGDVSVTGDLTLTSTDAGSTAEPQLVLYRNSASPADGDVLANIDFTGNNSSANSKVYGALQAKVTDVTDGTEDANFSFKVMSNGTLTNVMNLKGNGDSQILTNNLALMQGVNLKFEGATNNNFETTLTVTDPTADRTVTIPNATGTLSLLTNTETLTNKTLTTPVINGFSGTGNGSITGDLTLTSTDAGSGSDPEIIFFRNSASPADNDALGKFIFKGNNSAAEETQYAAIVSRLTDATNGTEDGTFELQTISGGSVATNVRIDASSTVGIRLLNGGERNIRFDTGTAFSGSHIDLAPTSATGARTVTLPDATGTVLTTGNSDTPTTTTSSSDADFVLVDDGGTMKKITPSNLGITGGGTTAAFATAMAMVL
tara:strand:+ start:248 stop:1678 length:1431 start_codon:yes stop_codon:yes gene_type:complete